MSGPSGPVQCFYSCDRLAEMAGAGFTSSGLSRASQFERPLAQSTEVLTKPSQIRCRAEIAAFDGFFSRYLPRTREYLSALTHEPRVRFAQFFRVNHCGFRTGGSNLIVVRYVDAINQNCVTSYGVGAMKVTKRYS